MVPVWHDHIALVVALHDPLYPTQTEDKRMIKKEVKDKAYIA